MTDRTAPLGRQTMLWRMDEFEIDLDEHSGGVRPVSVG